MGTSLFVFGAFVLLIVGCEATLWVLFQRKIPRYCFSSDSGNQHGSETAIHHRYRAFFIVHTIGMITCVFITVLVLWVN